MIDIFFFMMKCFFYIVVCIILLISIKEYLSYRRLAFYKKQGVKTFYIPFLGITQYIKKDRNTTDSLSKLREFVQTHQKEDVVAINSMLGPHTITFLLNDDLIREFLVKEIDCSIKKTIFASVNVGFFFENGEKVHDARSSYSKFFNFDNIKKMSSAISIIVEKKLKEWKTENLKEDEWTKVKVKDMLNNIFAFIVNCSLFGEEEVQRISTGENLCEAIPRYLNGAFGYYSLPFAHMVIRLFRLAGFLPESQDRVKMYAEIENKCWELYQKRIKDGPKKIPNLLDLLISRNEDLKQHGKEELTKREIAGDFIVFQFAGADTSLEITTTSILSMAKNEGFKQEMFRIADEILSKKKEQSPLAYEDFNDHERLNEFTMESTRLGSPVATLSPRTLIKDVKIGNINFIKGSEIMIPVNIMQTISKYWENPLDFNPDRMKKDDFSKLKRTAYMPFGMGKRICVGKSLGDLVVKILLISFFGSIDVSQDIEYIEKKDINLTYGYTEPFVLMKPRSSTNPK